MCENISSVVVRALKKHLADLDLTHHDGEIKIITDQTKKIMLKNKLGPPADFGK